MMILLVMVGCATKKNDKQTPLKKEVSTSTLDSKKKEKEIELDLEGMYYTDLGEIATIEKKDNNNWSIKYSTQEGEIESTFITKWNENNKRYLSKSMMKKSDGYEGFTIDIEYISLSEISFKMTDGNKAHDMLFSNRKPTKKPTIDDSYNVLLKGDLTPFCGQFSNDEFNKSIAESDFTLGGYSPDDYFNNRTTVFPALSKEGYWNGMSSHGSYEIKQIDLPVKVNEYYQANVYGTNVGANNEEITFYLVPPEVMGPDNTIVNEKRVFQVMHDKKLKLLEYQKDNWWEKYRNSNS